MHLGARNNAILMEQTAERQTELDKIFVHHRQRQTMTVKAGGDWYVLSLPRDLDRPMQVLQWAHYFAGKKWATVELLDEFLKRVAAIQGWNLEDSHIFGGSDAGR